MIRGGVFIPEEYSSLDGRSKLNSPGGCHNSYCMIPVTIPSSLPDRESATAIDLTVRSLPQVVVTLLIRTQKGICGLNRLLDFAELELQADFFPAFSK